MSQQPARPRTADELRRAWDDFFAARGHTIVPSSGLIPTHPSAPMFTNSGMMPFVPYFLGEEPVPYSPRRAASVQKCVRAGGKHNDLDEIGRSPRHLSFFEMLGNFSFGDYFKPDAIRWAWEFVTEALGIDGDRIWVTCHVSDDEAEQIWVDDVGFPIERIQRLDKDNFWEMGETGPCGPSSELFFDYGPELGPAGGPANPDAEHRYVEIWNLVFQQYFRSEDGRLSDLPTKNIDTGAGLERILAVLADSPSLYDADVLSGLVDEAQSVTARRLGDGELSDIALRLLADHTRTATFLVADGVVPSNEDRGYVLRRIIRRAVRFAYMLDVERAVMPPLVERCIQIMGGAYPELVEGHDRVVDMISREEEGFRRTLARGSVLLDSALDAVPQGGHLPGQVAFELHDTYGFPLEVTSEMADLRGVTVDLEGFDSEMAAQRERSRAAGKRTGVAAGESADAERALLAEHGPTVFTGREEETTSATVLAVIGDGLFLDRTPFYAESGGQVGDTGTITTPTGTARVVDTTYALPGLHRHTFELVEGTIEPGQEATASIDAERRAAIRRNHTGTHVLHWALREVLGEHVKQQGSWVGPDRLRFDFAHHGALSQDEIRRIEDLANHEILDNASVRHYETTMEEARRLGAIMFFGDKYGEVVRVLEAGRHSTELCGGTHVGALGDIGPLKVVSETSIGSNIRRIEAVTGTGPIERLRLEEDRLRSAADLLGVPTEDLQGGIEKRLAELRSAREELKALRKQLAGSQADELVDAAVDGVVVARIDADSRDEVRDLAVALRDRPGIRAVVLGASPGGKGVALVSAVAPDSGLNAAELIADAARTVGGGGGKGADLAAAGGKHPEHLDEALEQVRAAAGVAG
ncbi:alanine--tRNA ligase [Dermatobacter hominis]|uniref:alanine--tRNA ligase n=1 Tax=Dermatobacter hominis TaxID=2884263 RepID=UPI001D105136|nr:alanine--tRNA ligase [Dermatobacter hominis]UDY36178.1 alanine--tRNA ligase [Dermatobacter hominis]